MKKQTIIYLLLLLGLVAGVRHASAQHYVGIRGGFGGGTARMYPAQDMSYLWDFANGGVSWKYYSAEPVVGAVQVDVEFMQRGYVMVRPQTSPIDTVRHMFRTNSVIVPFAWQPHVYFFKRSLRVFLNAAITLSYNFDAGEKRVSILNGFLSEAPRAFQLNRDNRFGYGLMGGLGVGYLAGRFEFFAEGRYHFGYSDIFKNSNVYPDNYFLRSPLDNINISAGIFYRLGKGGILSQPRTPKPKTPKEEQTHFESHGSGGGY